MRLPSTGYVVARNFNDEVIAWGFGTLTDALDKADELDPDSTNGFYVRKATEEEDGWSELVGAGRDPAGRPDPRTHPEFWTE